MYTYYFLLKIRLGKDMTCKLRLFSFCASRCCVRNIAARCRLPSYLIIGPGLSLSFHVGFRFKLSVRLKDPLLADRFVLSADLNFSRLAFAEDTVGRIKELIPVGVARTVDRLLGRFFCSAFFSLGIRLDGFRGRAADFF